MKLSWIAFMILYISDILITEHKRVPYNEKIEYWRNQCNIDLQNCNLTKSLLSSDSAFKYCDKRDSIKGFIWGNF